MKLRPAMKLMTVGTMLAIAALSAPVTTADDSGLEFTQELLKMLDKDNMITKKNFMTLMERRFDRMDKKKIGKISKADVMVIFTDKP